MKEIWKPNEAVNLANEFVNKTEQEYIDFLYQKSTTNPNSEEARIAGEKLYSEINRLFKKNTDYESELNNDLKRYEDGDKTWWENDSLGG